MRCCRISVIIVILLLGALLGCGTKQPDQQASSFFITSRIAVDHVYVNEQGSIAVYSFDRSTGTFSLLQKIPPLKIDDLTIQLNQVSYSASMNQVIAAYSYAPDLGDNLTVLRQFQPDITGQLTDVSEIQILGWWNQVVPIANTNAIAISTSYRSMILEPGSPGGPLNSSGSDLEYFYYAAAPSNAQVLIGEMVSPTLTLQGPISIGAYQFGANPTSLLPGPVIAGNGPGASTPVFSLDGTRILMADELNVYVFAFDPGSGSISLRSTNALAERAVLGYLQDDTPVTLSNDVSTVELRHRDPINDLLSDPWATLPVNGAEAAVAPDGAVIFISDFAGTLTALQLQSGQHYSLSSISIPQNSEISPYGVT